jgi:hypothetical protein
MIRDGNLRKRGLMYWRVTSGARARVRWRVQIMSVARRGCSAAIKFTKTASARQRMQTVHTAIKSMLTVMPLRGRTAPGRTAEVQKGVHTGLLFQGERFLDVHESS